VHLNVEWRDLPEDAWHHKVRTIQGREVPATETVWMRTREVWVHAVDLDNGAAFRDIPVPVLERLLSDITGAWKARGTDKDLVLKVDGAQYLSELGDLDSNNPEIVSGSLADITAWAGGRPAAGIASNKQEKPIAPHWI
jgi:maleylpyruvate isomerase